MMWNVSPALVVLWLMILVTFVVFGRGSLLLAVPPGLRGHSAGLARLAVVLLYVAMLLLSLLFAVTLEAITGWLTA